MFLIWSFPTIPKHIFSISIFHIPSAGRSFMLEFLIWSFKVIWFGAFQIACGLFGHLLFGFRFQERSAFFADSEGKSVFSLILDHDPICWMLWYHDGFFQTTSGFRSDHCHEIFWTFWVLFDYLGWFCLLLCLCIILTWNPFDYHISRLLLVVHQRNYCLGISSLWL